MIVAQALSEPNPAAHAIWWVAGAIALVLGVLVVLELIDYVRYRVTQPSDGPPTESDARQGDFRYERPTSELRRRFLRRPAARTKSWKEGLIEPGRDREDN